jgi:hypothetical protein
MPGFPVQPGFFSAANESSMPLIVFTNNLFSLQWNIFSRI